MSRKLIIPILSAVISVAAFSIHAQQITDHIARDGDKLHPGVASSQNLIRSICDSTKTVLLNPDAAVFDSSLDAATYTDSDTISYVQSATKHRFIFRSDALSYLGYENRATYFRLDSSVNVAHFPLQPGETVLGTWTGDVLHYGSMLLKRMRGTSTSHADGGWTLTDGTDTIRNATRLLWTLDMEYADKDSVDTSLPDSIASEKISEMQVDAKTLLSERLLTERAMWFAEDARYPVLTDTSISRLMLNGEGIPTDTVPVSLLAMYYPPSWQYSDTGEDMPVIKPSGILAKNRPGSYDGDGNGEQSGSLTIGEPEVSGNLVSVTIFSQSGPVMATVTLFSDSGIMLTEPSPVTVGTVPQTHSVEVPSGWSGVVLLRVDAGEESYTKKIIR